MLYFLPLLLSSGAVLGLLIVTGRWLGTRSISARLTTLTVAVALGALGLMPILAGMEGHPPVPFVLPLVAALLLLLEDPGGLAFRPWPLVIGYAVALVAVGASAYARVRQTY